MSGTRKKVEITLGNFACSVEGYDNPAEQMREVLLMMRDIMGDAPALSGQDAIGAVTLAQIEGALDRGAGKVADDRPGTITIRAVREGSGERADVAGSGSIFAPPHGRSGMSHAPSIFTRPMEAAKAHGDASVRNVFSAPEISRPDR